MKRIISVLAFITILFTACSSGCNIEVGESMSKINNQYTPYITINALSVFEINNSYLLTVDDGVVVQKIAEFSSDRKCYRTQGIELIKDDETNQFLGMSFTKLTEKIGQPHADIGSGFYIPAYITENANLVCFKLEDQIVIEIIKRDLLTNKIVDRISNY